VDEEFYLLMTRFDKNRLVKGIQSGYTLKVVLTCA